jgi:hypothetical protein
MHIAKGFNLPEDAANQLARLVQIKLSEMAPKAVQQNRQISSKG